MYDRQNGAGDSSNSDISENIAGYWRLGRGGACTEHLAERRTAIENMAQRGMTEYEEFKKMAALRDRGGLFDGNGL